MLYSYVTIKKTMIEKLGFSGIEALITLYELNKPLYIRELLKKSKISPSVIYRVLTVLLEFNLITIEYKLNRRYIKLTENGKKVAYHIIEAEKIISAIKESE